MRPPEHLDSSTAEASWLTEGPNSGGVAGWLLFAGHVFRFWNDFSSGEVEQGIPVAEWLRVYGSVHPSIAAELRRREGE